MTCPFCSNIETKVTDKRASENAIRRRRECLKCGKRFTTYERAEIDLTIIKKDSRREPFNREKLKTGILKACEKRPVSSEQINNTITKIEETLLKKGGEIKSSAIGELIMKELKKLDKVAYIRFASVYKDFQDISDFKKQIKELK